MLPRVTAWTRVVPIEPSLDVRGAANIMPRRIVVAPQNVDKSGSDALHVGLRGILRAKRQLTEIAQETATMDSASTLKLRSGIDFKYEETASASAASRLRRDSLRL